MRGTHEPVMSAVSLLGPCTNPERTLLKWIRDARINLKTGLIVIALALAVWAVVIYVNMRDFVPDELTEEPASEP